MKVTFSSEFTSSLKRIFWRETPIYKFYSFFRWDLFRFFRNIWTFRKAIWNYQWWDYRYSLDFLQTSLEYMAPRFEKNGIEIDETRLPKVEKMKRAAQILKNLQNCNYITLAEGELGNIFLKPWEFEDVPEHPSLTRIIDTETEEEKAHNKKVFQRSNELEQLEWIELWTILSGEKICGGERKIDGSDLRGWWD